MEQSGIDQYSISRFLQKQPKQFSFTYLASPYTHADPAVQDARARAALLATMQIAGEGTPVFCPVTYSLALRTPEEALKPPQGWYAFDLNFLSSASRLITLQLPGWELSSGILIETAFALGRGIPIHPYPYSRIRELLDPETQETLDRTLPGETGDPHPPESGRGETASTGTSPVDPQT